ncbi:unnamed protein product [Adineta ricciae]|uniref:Galactosylceramide sulfotransferase-like n=1 Tax=Adineta ricciae TaxID=249248 RepID=A0A814TTQ8_ADIRI|nr:unnamed protein product [Adineta ricciae]
MINTTATTTDTIIAIITHPRARIERSISSFPITPAIRRSAKRTVNTTKGKMKKKKTCRPKRNILFLKTHKTGSSTIQNIFLRYGDRNNLTIVLPEKYNYFGHPQPFNRSMLLPRYNQSSLTSQNNIFAHHARFNYEEMKSIMPNDTLFITILRDPVSLTESLFSYYNLKRLFGENSSMSFLETFFSISPNVSAYHALSYRRHLRKFGRNQMSFDLGFTVDNFDNLEVVQEFIQSIDSRFHFVMIADRMDESLVHLRHLLCWTVKDIIAFRHNARSGNNIEHFTDDLKQRIRLFNIADELLYKHFSDKLTRLTTKFGNETMQKEISHLKSTTKKMFHRCFKDEDSNTMIVNYRRNHTMSKICHDLVIAELPYTDLLRQKQSQLQPMTKVPSQDQTTTFII